MYKAYFKAGIFKK